MDTTQSSVPAFAPLAFSLSIHSEATVPALTSNAVDETNAFLFPTLLGVAGAVAVAGLLYTLLPAWISIPLAVWPGCKCFKYFRRYFESEYPKDRVQANREILSKVIDVEDAGRFADVAADIVKSHYGNQKFAVKANALRTGASADHYLYLATVFTFAPDCWGLCARRVYDLHLSGALHEPIR